MVELAHLARRQNLLQLLPTQRASIVREKERSCVVFAVVFLDIIPIVELLGGVSAIIYSALSSSRRDLSLGYLDEIVVVRSL